MSKNDVIVQAVESMKKGEYGLTAIKVELEANLNRRDHGGCDYCDGGDRTCGECDGEWEGERCSDECDEGYFLCDDCNGEQTVECERCDGDGHILLQSGNRSTLNCRDCLGSGTVDCVNCSGEGHFECEECSGDGYYSNCEWCEEGTTSCDECDGGDSDDTQRWGSNMFCHEWLMQKLAELDLAELDPTAVFHTGHDGYNTHWLPKGALKYAEFYLDGSVDSEFTFTLAMDKPENVLLLPKIIEIWNDFTEAVGGGVDVHGAGMHMALINDPECRYPVGRSMMDNNKYHNFQKSMQLLMPALYFLASSSDDSRGMSFRRPEIGCDTHRAAIDWRGGALEFRVFNTCYDQPEAILDNVVVMSNAMKYWRSKYKKHGLGKITKAIQFGVDGDDKLDRFYITEQHIDLLNAGLQILKPSYYTIREVKLQRKFSKTKTHCKNRFKQAKLEAEIQYKEYENRFSWSVVMRKHDRIAHAISNNNTAEFNDEQLARIEQAVQPEIEEFAKTKQSLARYVEDKLKTLQQAPVGQYVLREES